MVARSPPKTKAQGSSPWCIEPFDGWFIRMSLVNFFYFLADSRYSAASSMMRALDCGAPLGWRSHESLLSMIQSWKTIYWLISQTHAGLQDTLSIEHSVDSH